jgi:hypothetical protein
MSEWEIGGHEVTWMIIGAMALAILFEIGLILREWIIKRSRPSNAADDPCSWCAGTGSVPSFDDTFVDAQDRCPICDGSGRKLGQ